MSSIDVEAVDDVEEEDAVDAASRSLDPSADYVLYGGKGGVGKTTMAAATGLASAESGATTLVVSTDPAHSLSDTFETDVPPRPSRIRDEVPLYAAEIDPDAAIEDGTAAFMAENEGGLGGLGEMLGGEGGPMESLMGGAMPGADEAAAMQTLLEYMDDERFDRVVVDTAPTGHTLRLLELPEVMDTMVGRMLSLRERLGGMMDGVKGMFGGNVEEDDVDQSVDDLRELSDRIERLRATLRDPERTDFRVVMVPEEMSVFESERLLTQLDEFEIPVGTVVVNKVMENLADVTDDVDASQFVSPNLDTCEFCQRRWDVQQDALASAQDVFRGHDIKRVPLFADEVRGERMLRIVAACLN
ncbi:ArsA family ATPase [Halostella sp. JP-L12]|uniref:ArsA family ATPase n=1 Tax=Halostella TaxID=1843185 RepID=UPI000EF8450E|nr:MULTISPECIES: ArsA family ATPase [Halostella]NHN47418.1 ArsA family ATPase [Halostella sp. JP-L12]